MAARLVEQAVHRAEVERSLGGLDQLPRDGREDRVEVQGIEQRPEPRQGAGIGGGGVTELAAEDEEGGAVNDELGGGAARDQMGDPVITARPSTSGGSAGSDEERDQCARQARARLADPGRGVFHEAGC